MIDSWNDLECTAGRPGFHYGSDGIRNLERNEIAGHFRPKDRRLRGCSGKTWPSQTRQLGNEAQSPIAGQQPPIVGLQAATVNRQSTCRAAKFVRRHVAIVIAAHNHFPAHYDFIDRSKKSAEVRMSECSSVCHWCP